MYCKLLDFLRKGLFTLLMLTTVGHLHAQRQMELLNRGVVAIRKSASQVYISWRMFGTDPADIGFNLYRSGTKLNTTPITTSTNYTDIISANGQYVVKPVIGGVEQEGSSPVGVWATNYLTINLNQPAGGTTPDGVAYTYSPNDCSVGDLDGDGEYEIVLKWDPSNSKDNSQSGYTGDVFLDGYKMNGTLMWRIDLGKNIRAGAHYTQFMVYDLDGDGKAEIVCKTAPGTKDGTGDFLKLGPAASDNDNADYRNSGGYILSGPEYLTVFSGEKGKELATANYNPPRGSVSSWGDSYGNRVDRFLACVAYLDGVHPSVVMCRGYYTRMVLAAWDWRNGTLTNRWTFDSNNGYSNYMGQGNHNLSVADVDGDGKDEIIYGASAFDDDGKPLYTTSLGHGDAIHVSDLNPDRPGYEVWEVHENVGVAYGSEMHDAKTGEILWGYGQPNSKDVGRGMSADIDSRYRGFESWSSAQDSVYNDKGVLISHNSPSYNFRIYWDGDLQDELLDGTKLDKWNSSGAGGTSRLVSFYNYNSAADNNSTKANPCLTADILGDWREEVILRSSNNHQFMIFTTTTPTNYRLYTLMHDPVYRLGVAWQNTAYNQPPHLGFYIGDGLDNVPVPNISLIRLGPKISISSPTDSSYYLPSSDVHVDASVAAVDSTVAKVEFYLADTKIGESVAEPYSIDLPGLGAGEYKITAKAIGDNGKSNTTDTLHVFVNNTPTASITSPADNLLFENTEDITITADASDSDNGIAKVEFYYENVKIGEDNTAPYSIVWQNPPTGSHLCTAKAIDSTGNNYSSAPITINVFSRPVVDITFPADNYNFAEPATVDFNVSATDLDGTVSKVEFYQDGTKIGEDVSSPYSYSIAGLGAGKYKLKAVSTDNDGYADSAEISINMYQKAEISTVLPEDTTYYFIPEDIPINALVTAQQGITKVDLYVNGVKKFTDTYSPYEFTLSGLTPGSYLLSAIATDSIGFTNSATSVTIHVLAKPQVSISSPANGSTLFLPEDSTIDINATDADGAITKVELYDGTTKLGEDLTSPYSFTITNIGFGSHEFSAIATDNDGYSDTSAIVMATLVAKPEISITSPSDNSSFITPVNISLEVSAADADGNVMKVEYYNGATKIGESTTLPFTYNWTEVPAADYDLVAVATDNDGYFTASDTIRFSVSNPTGIRSYGKSVVSVYPNPFTDAINVRLKGEFRYELYNVEGKILEDGVKSDRFSTGNNLPAGMYTIIISNETIRQSFLIVKK